MKELMEKDNALIMLESNGEVKKKKDSIFFID